MVSKYSKTKGYRPEHINQMQLERQRLEQLNQEYEAFSKLRQSWNHQLQPGHYRTKSGFHMKITGNQLSWSKQEVPAEQRQLPFGQAWLPFPPVAQPETPLTVEQLYGNDELQYWRVEPREVGFNDVGEYDDETGVFYKSYQLKKVVVKETNGVCEYEAVTTNVLDPAREHIRVYETGAILQMGPDSAQLQYAHDGPVADPPALVASGESGSDFSPEMLVSNGLNLGDNFGFNFNVDCDGFGAPGLSGNLMVNGSL